MSFARCLGCPAYEEANVAGRVDRHGVGKTCAVLLLKNGHAASDDEITSGS